MAQAPRAVGGQQSLELHREDQDQHQPEPEARHRLEKQRRDAAQRGRRRGPCAWPRRCRAGWRARSRARWRRRPAPRSPARSAGRPWAWQGGARGWTSRSRRAAPRPGSRGTARASGRSSPSWRCTAATSSRVAVWSTRNAAGSPVRRTRKKTTVTTPHTTMTAWTRRRRRNRRIASRYFLKADGAEVHVQLGQRLEPHDARAQRVDLDLLVERDHRRPVADLLLEVGEEREPLLRRRPRGASPCRASASSGGNGAQLIRVTEAQSRT